MYQRSTARERLEDYLRTVAAQQPATQHYFDALISKLDPHVLGPAASRRPGSIGAVLTEKKPKAIKVLLSTPPDPSRARVWSCRETAARSLPRGWVRRAVNFVVGEMVLAHPRWPKMEAEVRTAQRTYRQVRAVMDS